MSYHMIITPPRSYAPFFVIAVITINNIVEHNWRTDLKTISPTDIPYHYGSYDG